MKNLPEYQFAGIIPARYASSRFPGKPLVMIGDRTMVMRVYEQAMKSLELVYVATDDERILEAVVKSGGNAVMTSSRHLSGTDRCAEASQIISRETGKKFDIVLNIQGDEPFIKPEQLDQLRACFTSDDVEIATLIRKTEAGEDIFNPNQVKVVINKYGNAIYFSRSAVPYYRDADPPEWSKNHTFFKHLGLYAYRTGTLKRITAMPRSSLEIAESLEQNRWIENGIKIRTAITKWDSISIDTPSDLELAMKRFDNFI
jgi:3-deoxy-manno-octulosonate cytidylyltransferase (CMP-KDO synthetase)